MSKKVVKLRDLPGSEIDRLDNIGVAVEALLDEEIRERNEDSVLTSGVHLKAAREAIEALRTVIHEG